MFSNLFYKLFLQRFTNCFAARLQVVLKLCFGLLDFQMGPVGPDVSGGCPEVVLELCC